MEQQNSTAPVEQVEPASAPVGHTGAILLARMNEIAAEMVVLAQAVGQLNETVTRIERDVQLAARGRTPSGAAIPKGITSRPNPMTKPAMPLNSRIMFDSGREEALLNVRALFQHRRPWWQRLPGLQRG